MSKPMYERGYRQTGLGRSLMSLKNPATSMKIPCTAPHSTMHEVNKLHDDVISRTKWLSINLNPHRSCQYMNEGEHVFTNLNASTGNDAHQEIRNNARHCHHEALNNGHLCEE